MTDQFFWSYSYQANYFSEKSAFGLIPINPYGIGV